MSASARKLTLNKLVVALGFALTLLVVATLNAARTQNDSVPAVQVTEMIARVRAAPVTQGPTAGALPLGQRLLIEARYEEAYELFAALLENGQENPRPFMVRRCLRSTSAVRRTRNHWLAPQVKFIWRELATRPAQNQDWRIL